MSNAPVTYKTVNNGNVSMLEVAQYLKDKKEAAGVFSNMEQLADMAIQLIKHGVQVPEDKDIDFSQLKTAYAGLAFDSAIALLCAKENQNPNALDPIEKLASLALSFAGVGEGISKAPTEEMREYLRDSLAGQLQAWSESTAEDVKPVLNSILNLFNPVTEGLAQPKLFSPEYTEAMKKYKQMVADNNGEETEEAILQFQKAMYLAPDWFVDDVFKGMGEQGLSPKPDGYTDAGEPVCSLDTIANHLGISTEEAALSFEKFQQQRQDDGLPEIELVDPSTVHKIQ